MIVFVSDLFVKDYVGGGELSTQALIETSLMPVAQINSRFLTVEIMSQYPNAFWIFWQLHRSVAGLFGICNQKLVVFSH